MKAQAVADPEVRTRLARGRLEALGVMPYLAQALTAMTFYEVADLGTIGIDDRFRVYVDPSVVRSWSIAQLAGALLHEANHVLRGHHARAPYLGANHKAWNIAGDLEINDDLLAAQIELPDGALHPTILGFSANLTAETYYDLLPRALSGSGCDCGSGATGRRPQHELGSDDELGLPRSRVRAIIDAVAEDVRGADIGTVPAGLARWANALISEVSWERVLRTLVRRGVTRGTGNTDYSWSPPSRRFKPPLIMPRLRAKRATVLCVVDTSGSMSQDLLNRALGEVAEIAQTSCVQEVYLASCDAAVTYLGRRRKMTPLALNGGGGTNLETAVSVIRDRNIDPAVVVFLTDGFNDWSAHPPAELARRLSVVVSPRHAPAPPRWAAHVALPV